MSYKVSGIFLIKDISAVNPKKPKYAVCICIDPVSFLLINSENRPMYDCIPILKKRDRPFPEHDSFIACKNLHTADISQLVSSHGKVDSLELQTNRDKIAGSKFLTRLQKVTILSALDEILKPEIK